MEFITYNAEQSTMFDIIDGGEQFQKQKSTDWKWKFADYPKETNGIKVFSCFSCGGGSTMGYKLAGCEMLGNCEIDPKMNELYIKNHHPRFNYCMDIRDFNKLEDLPEELYNLDILDGSPPCTTFSMAGDREESWGKKKKFREGQAEQTLDDLSFVFIETANKLKPKTVIMENVEGLLLGNAYEYVKRIYKEFDEAGYKVRHWLLKGENMGVPQRRHRTFFLAIRKDVLFNIFDIDMIFNYEPILYKQIKEGKGREVNKNSQSFIVLNNAYPYEKAFDEVLYRLYKKRSCFTDSIACNDDVLPTLKASLSIYRAGECSTISAQDIINMQTFPENYEFDNNTVSSIAYVCGMSVPPVMMKRFVTRLIENGVYDYKLTQSGKEGKHEPKNIIQRLSP